MRTIGAAGNERAGEVLFLIDEASAISSLSALEEALVRGRSAGVRLLLAYQSDSQVQAAFKDKPTLLYDNCGTQIYLGAGSIETAERISKSLGEWTQVVEGYNENASRSWNSDWVYSSTNAGQQQLSRGNSLNYSVNGRALLQASEVLTLSDEYLIALQRGMLPILAKRIKYYRDAAFTPSVARWLMKAAGWGVLVAAGAVAALASICGR